MIFHSHGLARGDELTRIWAWITLLSLVWFSYKPCKFAIQFSHFSPLIPFFSTKSGISLVGFPQNQGFLQFPKLEAFHDISTSFQCRDTYFFMPQSIARWAPSRYCTYHWNVLKSLQGSNRKRRNLKSHPKYTSFKKCIYSIYVCIIIIYSFRYSSYIINHIVSTSRCVVSILCVWIHEDTTRIWSRSIMLN